LTSQNIKGRILVVDDEPDITLTLKAGLETVGLFDVNAFNDPEAALKSFKPDFYALILIDIMMPKMDGFQLYERLKKTDPDLKAFFLTASEMFHEDRRGLAHCALNNDHRRKLSHLPAIILYRPIKILILFITQSSKPRCPGE
jgi:CheY-like chemotaxis protein